MSLEVGTLVLGYTIGRRIGGGSFGEVYEAAATGQRVAVKFISREKIVDRWLVREKAALDAIKVRPHSGLVRVLCHGDVESPNGYAVVMPLADRSLRDELRGKQPDLDSLVRWVRELAGGLDHLHALGFTHGDVTPANALLFGRAAVLTDFGFAREGVNAATSITVRNSTHYAPPEFQDDKTYGPQSDQFSLAATYLHLRTSDLPLGPLGRPKLGDLPAEERRVLEIAFALQPEDRYPSCGEFALALAAAVVPPPPLTDFSLPNVVDRLNSVERSLDSLAPRRPGRWKDVMKDPTLWRETWRWAWGKMKPWLPVGVAAAQAVLIGLVFASTVPTSPPPPTTGFVTSGELAALQKQIDDSQREALNLRAQLEAQRDGADFPRLFARALAAYKKGDFATARQLLDACAADERQFEYHLLQNAVTEGTVKQKGFDPEEQLNLRLYQVTDGTSPVRTVAFSPNDGGQRVTWGGDDQKVNVRDATGKGRRVLVTEYEAGVTVVAFHPNGLAVASATTKGDLRIREIEGPELFNSKPSGVPLTFIDFDPTGLRIAYAGPSNDILFHTLDDAPQASVVGFAPIAPYTGNRSVPRGPAPTVPPATPTTPAFNPGHTYAVAVSRDWRWVACKDTNSHCHLIDLTNGGNKKLLDRAVGVEPAGFSQLGPLAFCPRGQRLAVAASDLKNTPRDRRVAVWDLTRERATLLDVPPSVVTTSLAFPHEGRVVTGSEDGVLRIWHVDTGRELLALKTHAGAVNAIAVSPDGKRIVTGGADGKVLVWGTEAK